MRTLILGTACLLLLGLTAYLGARSQNDKVKVRLRLIDADSSQKMAGIVRLFQGQDKNALRIPGVLDRLRGLKVPEDVGGWFVVPADGVELSLPRSRLRMEALSGLETGRALQELDLAKRAPDEITVKIPYLFRPEKRNLVAGNTHLHLMNLPQADAEEYLRHIPAADGLRVLFISYLERNKDDLNYITNKYPIGDLPKFTATGVLFNNGQEHRHNFQAYGQGYGHVMFLNIKNLVQPVSIGPGITGKGFDDPPLRPGIDDAKKQGGTIIWCHNANGFEDVLSAISGRLDALNVFDGSRTGNFEENYYKYLNIGLHMPISTGTDWFMYDFSRVYARVPGKLTIPAWLDAVKAGRCQATNGPLLSLTVDGRDMGDMIDLNDPKIVRIEASAIGRHDFQRLQLLHNGKVIKTVASEGKNPFRGKLVHEMRVDAPAWFAVRIDSQAKNEFDRVLFAHSSPVYVNFKGRGVFDVEAGRDLLKQVEEGKAAIQARGRFSSPQAGEKLLALYDEATRDIEKRINQRK